MDHSGSKSTDRRAYAAFVGQVELRSIWLRSARIENVFGTTPPDELAISVDGDSRWEPLPGGFRSFQTYLIHISSRDATRYADIDVTFVADYDSIQPMTDELFETFGMYNLPLNTWPYLREYAATTVGRMGWLPITLPTFKVGTPLDSHGSNPLSKKAEVPAKRTGKSSSKVVTGASRRTRR